jgi:hypothetical protein
MIVQILNLIIVMIVRIIIGGDFKVGENFYINNSDKFYFQYFLRNFAFKFQNHSAE